MIIKLFIFRALACTSLLYVFFVKFAIVITFFREIVNYGKIFLRKAKKITVKRRFCSKVVPDL